VVCAQHPSSGAAQAVYAVDESSMTKKRVTHAFSAGGVVFRTSAAPSGGAEEGGLVEIVLVGHVRENIWTLPKGTPAPPRVARADGAARGA